MYINIYQSIYIGTYLYIDIDEMPRDPSSYGLYWLVAVMLLHTITHSAYRQYDIRYVFKSFVIICTYHMCVCVCLSMWLSMDGSPPLPMACFGLNANIVCAARHNTKTNTISSTT